MPSLEIQLAPEARRCIEQLKRYPGFFEKAIEPSADSAGQLLASKISETQLSGDPLGVRSGTLRKSVSCRVQKNAKSVTVAIGVTQGPAQPYARIQDQGGTIKAAPGKALAVPLPAAMTPSGRPKYPGGPRQAGEKHGEDVFMLKRDGKPPLIVLVRRVRGSNKGRAVKLIPLFVLLKSVTIKPTYWLTKGVERNLNVFEMAFSKAMDRRLLEFK